MRRRISRRTFTLAALAPLLPSLAVVGARHGIASPAGVTIVSPGGPPPLIVTSELPQESVQYAAQELSWHLGKATGYSPQIVTEKSASLTRSVEPRIYLGETRFARKAKLRLKTLELESAFICTVGKDLCIVGPDSPGDPLSMDKSAGTLFGVYEFLERYVGVRWLWPGEVGTFVPQTRSLVVPPINEVVEPLFMQRQARAGLRMKSDAHPEMGFTPDVAMNYAKAQTVFMRRHRMGRRQPLKYGHAFTKWWDKFGVEHPEWFQLVNGKRGPIEDGARFSMCVSNQALREEIVSNWRQRGGGKVQRGLSLVNAVENDIPGLCQCDRCRALDGPEPAQYRQFISPKSKIANLPFVTDRYARSWLAIQQIAAKDDPDATVVGYAYMNYFAPPTSGVKLNQNILIGFCPSSWFYPRADDEHDWMKKQWLGWADTGARVLMRTNYFLDGYCMPYIFAHQFADDFQNAARNRMAGTDFDSLTGHWATQGPNLYLLMRLHTHPDAATDDLLEEYYSAFGPAMKDVKAYFDYWENYTNDGRLRQPEIFDRLQASRWRSWAKAANAMYPDDCFAAGEAKLKDAAAAAASDPEALERVKFLQIGLEHARLCSQAARKLSLGDPQSSLERGRTELDALLAFRRAHESILFSNLNQCAWVEGQSWKLSEDTKAQPLDD